jgi:hypothetical protein
MRDVMGCGLSTESGNSYLPEPPLNPLFETAQSALDKSCYLKINWKCSEDDFVSDVVKRMVRA